MKNLRWHIIGVLIIIVVVLGVAWFYNGGEHFKGVASVCYGFFSDGCLVHLQPNAFMRKNLIKNRHPKISDKESSKVIISECLSQKTYRKEKLIIKLTNTRVLAG